MLDKQLLEQLQEYVDQHSRKCCYRCKVLNFPKIDFKEKVYENIKSNEISDFIKNNRESTFAQLLFGFIDDRNLSDSDVYKRAGIDRRHFSKIRSNSDYRPGKNTIIALSIALELNEEEMGKLLCAAGYSLSNNDTFDLVIKFCLEKKIYDIDSINQALDYFSLKTLAGVLE